MGRELTHNYAGSDETSFWWATTDNDKFDRELDLYRLSRALDDHDHSTGKGLPVAVMGAGSIKDFMYGDQSIPTSAYKDLSVTTAKLADGAVTDAKMNPVKANRGGDTFTGDIRIQRSEGANQGAIYFGTGLNYLFFDGVNFTINNAGGNAITLVGYARVYAPANNNVGYMYYSANANSFIGFDGANMLASWPDTPGVSANTGVLCTKANCMEVPIQGTIMFTTLAYLTAAGARWTRFTQASGRIMAAAGTSNLGVTLNENEWHGVSWNPVLGAPITATHNLTSPAGAAGGTAGADTTHIFMAASSANNNATGATSVSAADHAHSVTGGGGGGGAVTGTITIAGANYLPPLYAGIWGTRLT